MKIYNLFPLLAGPFSEWHPHLQRAADMGFDWVFVNPIQQPGVSGSLYSIADYFHINPRLLKAGSNKRPDTQVKDMTRQAGKLGMRVMIDLVINHCAVDSRLVKEHPAWFVRDGKGVANPYCVEEDGTKVVWRDLAQFDHKRDFEGLLNFCVKFVEHMLDLGFSGFRCDAAYQVPTRFWQRLIEQVRARHPDVLFAAETLGCTPEMTRETASAGFDYIFNSAKWWDFESPWLLEQHELTREIAPSISFPETHDTERLYVESDHNVEALKQRYLFTALFSAGVMMPVGYEFAFSRRLHVVHTRPEHWEDPGADLTGFIANVNRIKSEHPVFQEDGLIQRLESGNPGVLVLWKASRQGQEQALLIINKDPWSRQPFHCDDLYRHIQAPPPLVDVSPEWTMDYLPTPFDFELGPGMARVLVAGG